MKVKIGKNRKPKVKIHEHDVYSLDVTLSYILIPALEKLLKTQCGYPSVDCEDVPEEMRYPEEHRNNIGYEYEYVDPPRVKARWEYVVNEMIQGFTVYKNHDPLLVTERERMQMRRGTMLFGKYYDALVS